MNPPVAVNIACPAKVNLALSVGSVTAVGAGGDGRHPIASWMVAVNFADQLTLQRSTDGMSRFDIAFDDRVPCAAGHSRPTVDWPLEKDLVYRAHALLEQRVGRSLPVQLTLRKRIPAGTGLGGGSSDAAGTLAGLNDLFELKLKREALHALAATLGSDVAFVLSAIQGEPAALATGFGEMIEPRPLKQAIELVLLLPPLACPTGEVYRAFDELSGTSAPRAPDAARVRALAGQSPLRADALFNDLAQPACKVRPPLATLCDTLHTMTRRPIHITGSGAAMFIVAADRRDADALVQAITSSVPVSAIAAQTL